MIISEKLVKIIDATKRKYPKESYGGCFQASRYIVTKLSDSKELVLNIKVGKHKLLKHCVVLLEDLIIDTQYYQFGLLINSNNILETAEQEKFLFTKEEHEKLLPRFKAGDKK